MTYRFIIKYKGGDQSSFSHLSLGDLYGLIKSHYNNDLQYTKEEITWKYIITTELE